MISDTAGQIRLDNILCQPIFGQVKKLREEYVESEADLEDHPKFAYSWNVPRCLVRYGAVLLVM